VTEARFSLTWVIQTAHLVRNPPKEEKMMPHNCTLSANLESGEIHPVIPGQAIQFLAVHPVTGQATGCAFRVS